MRISFLMLVALSGCGPLTFPMVVRLEPEEQKGVDEVWKNILTPPERLERTLLLDVLLSCQFHQKGVDRLQMVSEKDVGKDRVTMTVHFEREHPERDEFTVTVRNAWGITRRQEHYSGEEVLKRVEYWSQNTESETMPSEAKKEREARLAEIEAATMPAP